MNWKRGFVRLAIVVAIVALPLLGFTGYDWWQIHRFDEQQRQYLRQQQQQGLIIPDARVISRSAIPTGPSSPWPLIAAYGIAGLFAAATVSWVGIGFRRK